MMQQTELVNFDKRLTKLEKHLAGLRSAAQRGCPLGSTLDDIHRELVQLGAALKAAQDTDETTNAELDRVAERYKKVYGDLEAVAEAGDDAGHQEKQIVIASGNRIPSFFYGTTARHPGLWKLFERITTVLGVAMLPFAAWFITYLIVFWKLPFLSGQTGHFSGPNMVSFAIGLFVGAIIHEFAHGIVLANNGIKIKRVGAVLGSIVGGMVEAEETTFFQADPSVHLRFNAAGLGNNALLAIILALLAFATRLEVFAFLAMGDLLFGVMNSSLITPMDGGWVYEDMVGRYVLNKTAQRILLNGRLALFLGWLLLFAYVGLSRAL